MFSLTELELATLDNPTRLMIRKIKDRPGYYEMYASQNGYAVVSHNGRRTVTIGSSALVVSEWARFASEDLSVEATRERTLIFKQPRMDTPPVVRTELSKPRSAAKTAREMQAPPRVRAAEEQAPAPIQDQAPKKKEDVAAPRTMNLQTCVTFLNNMKAADPDGLVLSVDSDGYLEVLRRYGRKRTDA